MKASKQWIQSLSNYTRESFLGALAKALLLLLILMSLMRFLFYWSITAKIGDIGFIELIRVGFLGLRFDLLVLGFFMIPVVLFAPIMLLSPNLISKLVRLLSFYLSAVWTLVVGLSFADFLYFSFGQGRLSLLALTSAEGQEILWSSWSRLAPQDLLMNGLIFFCLLLIGNRSLVSLRNSPVANSHTQSEGPKAFWVRWGICFILVALSARGTVTSHHLEWSHTQIFAQRELQELAINSIWAWDKNPGR